MLASATAANRHKISQREHTHKPACSKRLIDLEQINVGLAEACTSVPAQECKGECVKQCRGGYDVNRMMEELGGDGTKQRV